MSGVPADRSGIAGEGGRGPVGPAELAALLGARASARVFAPRAVTRDEIAALVDAATLAPSGQNRQPWAFHALLDPARIRRVGDLVEARVAELAPLVDPEFAPLFANYRPFMTAIGAAPALLFVAAKPYESLRRLFPEDAAAALPGGDDTTHIQSAAAAVAYLLLAAEARGLAACWNTNALLARAAIEADLGIAPPWSLLCAVALGHPAAPRGAPVAKKRRPVASVLTFHE